VGLLAVALGAVLWLGFTSDGDAEPSAYLGEVGTPIRYPYVPPDETPESAATPRPRPTFTGNLVGTAEERDEERRNDLLQILGALNAYRERNGEYINTSDNIQTLCAFKDVDAGCGLASFMGGEVPVDPSGEPTRNGYWYQSNGETLRIYAAVEGDIPDDERCDTNYVDFEDRVMICVTAP
jgi:hypothetical protein